MRIIAPCVNCAEEQKTPDASKLQILIGELDETGVVYLDCPKGHKSAVMYDARRYEVLLRSGGKALLQGYANESVASLSAALERAYEFYVRVVCRFKRIRQEEIDKAWKTVGSQSERQLGAFNFVFLLQENSAIKLDPKIPEIRNKIVHKGRIAKERDALEFGELVFKRIRRIEKAMASYSEAVDEESKHELAVQEKSIPKNMRFARLKVTSVVIDGENKVVGFPERFSDYLVALRQSMEKGLG